MDDKAWYWRKAQLQPTLYDHQTAVETARSSVDSWREPILRSILRSILRTMDISCLTSTTRIGKWVSPSEATEQIDHVSSSGEKKSPLNIHGEVFSTISPRRS